MMTTTINKGQQAGLSKEVPQKSRKIMAITQKEILDMKEALKNTPKKQRPGIGLSDLSLDTSTREIVLGETSVFREQKFITKLATDNFWDNNVTESQKKMEQVKVYVIINNNKLSQGEVNIVCLATFNYINWESTFPTIQETKIKEKIIRKLPTPGYNHAKEFHGWYWHGQCWWNTSTREKYMNYLKQKFRMK